MVGISSSTGLVTGIDIAGTVKQLMAIEAQPRDRLVTRTKTYTDQQDALSQLTASVLSLQFTAQRFSAANTFKARIATSSNSTALGVSVTGTPRIGSTQFTPIRTAQSQQFLSSGVASLTAPLPAGKLTFSAAPRIDKGIALTELNGGEGVQRGKIRITDRAGASATIDLRYATTIDDVLTAINSNDLIDVTASVVGDRLKLVDNTGKTLSNLIVKDLEAGSTAADLGLDAVNVAADSYLGSDILSLHSGTRLSALNDGAGVRLSKDLDDLTITFRDGTTKNVGLRQIAKPEGFAATFTSTYDSKFSITAKNAGAEYDGVAVVFQDNPGVTQGNETVAYDDLAKTITVQIAAGSTTAADVISAINNDATASPYFTAQTIDGGIGSGIIDPSDTAITTGGTALASAVTTAVNANASIEISALTQGGEYDDVNILFVDDIGVTQGNETVVYDDSDPFNKTLTVHIKAGDTTANDVIAAISGDPVVGGLFSAANVSGSTGAGVIDVTDSGTTAGGAQTAIGISTAQSVDGIVKLTAKQQGEENDGVTIRYVNDPSVTAGNEIVEYDESNPSNKTLTVRIAAGESTANNVIAAINGNATASARFTAATASGGTGDRIVDARSTGETVGGAAQEERSPVSLGDLLTVLNEVDPTRLQAQIAADGDRIELIDISTDSGGTFSVSSFGDGHAAEDLGIAVSSSGDTIDSGRFIGGLKSRLVSSLNGGKGLDLGSVKVTDRSGASATLDLSGAETVDDILRAFNDSGLGVKAEINEAGNGITLRDTTGQFFSNFKVENTGATSSADLLNITASIPQTKIESGSLHAQFISEQSSLDSLNGGEGISRGKFLIRDSAGGGLIFDTTGDTLQSLGDLMDLINVQTKIKVRAEINETGDGLKITDLAGGSGKLSVQNSGNSTTATSLGIIGTGAIAPGDTNQSVSGTFNKVVNIEAGETITDVITKINALDAGFSASSFDFGSGTERYRISLTSNVSGQAGAFQIDSLESSFHFDEIVKGQDALLLFGSSTTSSAGVLTTSSNNTFANVIEGLSLTIKEASTSPVNITVESSNSSLLSTAQTFVEQYNALKDKLNEYTAFNESDSSTAILFGSNETHRIESELSEMLTRRYAGVGKFQSLQQLGFSFSQDGKLSLDETKLTEAYSADPQSVEDFFLKEQTSGGVAKKIGFAARFDVLMDSFAGAGSSLLVSRIEALQAKIDTNAARIDDWDEKLDRKQTALLTKFYNLETIISKLQSNLTAISSIQPISIDGSSG